MIITLGTAVAAALLTWLFTAIVLRNAARIGLVRTPNERSSHRDRTPHGGGVGFAVAATLITVPYDVHSGDDLLPVLSMALAIAAIGLWDDLRDLSVAIRLILQFVICGMLIHFFSPLPAVELPFELSLTGWPLTVVVLVGGVWWLNLFNFMDGIDGIAATQAMFVLAAAAIAALSVHPALMTESIGVWVIAVLAATTVFLAYNWPPARIFMGDTGSGYLAFAVLAIALYTIGRGWLGYGFWLVLVALFATDASLTLVTRTLTGHRWQVAHSGHAYQKLARHWQSHRAVTQAAVAFNLLWLAPLAGLAMMNRELAWLAVIAAYAGAAAALCLAVVRADTRHAR